MLDIENDWKKLRKMARVVASFANDFVIDMGGTYTSIRTGWAWGAQYAMGDMGFDQHIAKFAGVLCVSSRYAAC